MNPTNILALADAIEADGRFDLTHYSGCFCGAANRLWPNNSVDLTYFLSDKADALIIPPGFADRGSYPGNATAAQAAKVLRHLAATGAVDWSVDQRP